MTKRIGLTELKGLKVHQLMSDYYLLERLVADGSRTARQAQLKLESYAAPRLMRYLSAICGGEMRHAVGGDGCEGYECSGYESDVCECCGYDQDENHEPGEYCDYCGCREEDSAHQECDCEDECETGHADHDFESYYCDCYCPSELCYTCEMAQDGGSIRIGGLPSKLERWVEENSGGSEASRSDAWGEWLRFHDEHGAQALKWLWEGFESRDWPAGYGGEAWALIARYAYEYQAGTISAHAFMDRCWTLHHNGGNVFDKMFDSYKLDRQLQRQAADDYAYLTYTASREVKDLWVIRPFVLSDSLDRDPAWLGREIPSEVAW